MKRAIILVNHLVIVLQLGYQLQWALLFRSFTLHAPVYVSATMLLVLGLCIVWPVAFNGQFDCVFQTMYPEWLAQIKLWTSWLCHNLRFASTTAVQQIVIIEAKVCFWPIEMMHILFRLDHHHLVTEHVLHLKIVIVRWRWISALPGAKHTPRHCVWPKLRVLLIVLPLSL